MFAESSNKVPPIVSNNTTTGRLPLSLRTAPSVLTFTQPSGGGFHLNGFPLPVAFKVVKEPLMDIIWYEESLLVLSGTSKILFSLGLGSQECSAKVYTTPNIHPPKLAHEDKDPQDRGCPPSWCYFPPHRTPRRERGWNHIL